MSKAVYIDGEGSRVTGEYDGYGNLGMLENLGDGGDFALYHKTCYKLLGEPSYSKPSRDARDQGFFVGEFDPAEPKTAEDLSALRAQAEAEIAKARRQSQGYKALKDTLGGIKCKCGRDEHGIHTVMRNGAPALRCAGSRDNPPCNEPMELDKATRDKVSAVCVKYGLELLDDDKVTQ